MSSGQDYNWEMTGPPSESSWATDPQAAQSWNEYVQSGGGGWQAQEIAPPTYEQQVETARSWGVPEDQIASIVGTQESVEANNRAAAAAQNDLYGFTPTWASDYGYTAPPPSWLRPSDYVSQGFAAPYTKEQISSTIDPSWIRQMAGQTYASVKGPGDLSGGEYLIDPKTGKFIFDKSGNPIGVTYPQSHGFDDWVTTPLGGLAMTFGVPLLAAGATYALPYLAGEAALGAGAAAEGAGAAGAAGAGAGAGAGAAGAAGTAAATEATGLGGATLNSILAGAGKGALTGAAMGGISSGIQGGDIGQGILRGGLTGAVGGGIGAGLGGTPIANIVGGAGAGATGAALSGGNIGRGALMGGASGLLNYGTSQIPGLQGTPGQFGLGDIARGAITGGALSSAMGGNFGKGALGGIGGAYLSSQLSPVINNTYDKYFGTPTATSNVNYGVAPTGVNGTGIGFTSGSMDQALQQGLSTTPTTLSDLTTPADMQAALAVASPYVQTPEDVKLAEIAANFGVPPEALKDMLAQGEIQATMAGREEGVQTAGLTGKEYDMAKSAYDRYAANPNDAKAAKAYDETLGKAFASEANKPNSTIQKINDTRYFDAAENTYWNKDTSGQWNPTPASGSQQAASEVNLGPTDKGALTPGGIYGFGTPDVTSTTYAIGGTGSSAAPGEIASPIGLWGSGTGAGGVEPDMTDVSENQIKYKDPVTGEWKTTDAVELADIKSPDGKVQTAVPQDKVEKVVEQKEQVAKDKEAAADKAEKEAEKAGGGGQEGKTEDAKAKLEEAKTKAEQARKDAEAARADANAAKSASQQGQSGKITSIDKTTNVATIQFPNGDVTKAIVDPDAEINMQARVATTEAYGKGTPATTAGAGIPTGNQFAQVTTNKDGSQTYQNDDGSTYTIDKNGNLTETVDSDGQKYNIDENGQMVAVTGKEEGTPGSGGGTGGGYGTGIGTGTGSGSGAGAGGGGGGAGGSGTGSGKGSGKGTGTGSTTKLPTQQVPGKNVTINLPGMPNLTPGLVKGKSDYQLAGQFHFATGGGVSSPTTTGVGGTTMGQSPLDKYIANLAPGLVQGSHEDYQLPGYAKGGNIDAHNPEFFSEGGLGSLNNRYVKGKGDGTSDSIPAMLANGEFVIPADVVSSLGNGSNDSGAVLLDEFLRTIRQHKRRADARHLPPDSKGPLGYLLEAKKKVKK